MTGTLLKVTVWDCMKPYSCEVIHRTKIKCLLLLADPLVDALGIDGSIDYHSGNRYTLRNTQCNDNRPAADALGRIKKRYAEWILYINDKPAADALGIDG